MNGPGSLNHQARPICGHRGDISCSPPVQGCGSELVRRIRAGLCDRCLPLPFDLAFDHCRPAVGALPVILPGADDALVNHHQQDDWRRSARTVPASREQNTRAKINWCCSGKRAANHRATSDCLIAPSQPELRSSTPARWRVSARWQHFPNLLSKDAEI